MERAHILQTLNVQFVSESTQIIDGTFRDIYIYFETHTYIILFTAIRLQEDVKERLYIPRNSKI